MRAKVSGIEVEDIEQLHDLAESQWPAQGSMAIEGEKDQCFLKSHFQYGAVCTVLVQSVEILYQKDSG